MAVALGNSAIEMLTAPIMQYGKVDKERRNPLIMILGLAWAIVVTLGVTLTIVYWWMTAWYAATQSLEGDTASPPSPT